MNTADPQATTRDLAQRERIRTEMRVLLNQRAELAQLEKNAAVKEKTMRVAHDIRNPLAAIQAVCETLILETEDPAQLHRLGLIHRQVDELASLLAGAVDATDDHDDAPETIDLQGLAQSLVNLLQHQTRDDILFDIRLHDDLNCRLPPRGLTRSLYHLLRNAAEASMGREDGRILLRSRRFGPRLDVSVIDNGTGLPVDLVRQGVRAYSAARRGTALGLCSVERFVTGLGGRLLLRNRDTGGACVTMRLPADCHVPVALPREQPGR
jgi:two-component system sensor histidine kinase PilS (NtrC family)